MIVWMVRAGGDGQNEDFALENGLAVIGWDDLRDLSDVQDREALRELMREAYPSPDNYKIGNYVGQVWAFRGRIKEGDLVVLPLKTQPFIAIGKVNGPYLYRADNPQGAHHVRPVDWQKTDIPRSAFGQDLLYSLGAFMTVCRISRNNAEERIQVILATGEDPQVQRPPEAEEEATDVVAPPDIEVYAREQIREFIGRQFKEHDLASLVGAILRAQGYKTKVSTPGPDGGVDIIAGRGALGFDPPRLCVQVKASKSAQDVRAVREFQAVVGNFGADQGLFVSWGGYTKEALKEGRRVFFQLRLWDDADLVSAVLESYDGLPEDIKAELPLQRLWMLVPEETK
ncbi:MAG: restriction endonuclease [Candidatus Brocadiae bacterium]|nr:restriction endonuclease [Candidatus Brocadiia bacterium]